MSIWVRACCVRNVEIEPKALAEGIAARLPGIRSKLPKGSVAPSMPLQIDRASEPGREAFLLQYSEGQALHLELFAGTAARAQVEELLEELEGRDESGARRVREVLSRTVETVALQLKPGQHDAIAIGLAAAAWIAEHGHGLIEADGVGWAAPTPTGIETVLEE